MGWNKVSWWHYQTDCDVCNGCITSEDARYFCKECKYSVCMDCSSKLLARRRLPDGVFLPPTSDVAAAYPELTKGPGKVQPGDIFLCGPDKWGIHHCVLSIGQMRPDIKGAKLIKDQMPELQT